MNIDGSELQQLTDNDWNDHSPTWSPDGRLIVFSSDQDGDYEIFVMNSDGGSVQQLTFNDWNDYDPVWQP